MTRRILATSALLYANGPLHLGHILETTQTDIWVRAQRLQGHDCIYLCASDAHGSPIMLSAHRQGIEPEQLVERMHQQHQQDLKDFGIQLDAYHSTHSPENQKWVETIYQQLKEQGALTTRTIEQAYDTAQQMFLPDRFIKGTCPRCQTPDQYGDNCEACGACYTPKELINPYSILSNTMPEWRHSEHLFFDLPRYESFLKEWLNQPQVIAEELRNKMQEWFKAGLRDWNISRDAPYFGFPIPDRPNQYFYVWLDAPIGYIGTTQYWCDQHQRPINDYWKSDAPAEIYHFIGKDIVYFHALFWPALLHTAQLKTPTQLCVHGFLTINGQKMSKSRGTFILARDYLSHLPADALRYYFAAKLHPGIEDIDLSLDDFKQRINSDLIGKIINIISRSSMFITQHFDGNLADQLDQPELFQRWVDRGGEIIQAYEQRNTQRAIRIICECADECNQYIDQMKPWARIKDPTQRHSVQAISTTCLNLYRLIMTYLKPVLVDLTDKTEQFFGGPLSWQQRHQPLLKVTIPEYQPFMQRLTPEQVTALMNQRSIQGNTSMNSSASEATSAETQSFISIDEFSKIDMRAARVLTADLVDGSDKLIRFQLDLGPLGQRQVFSGIRAAYPDPSALVGQLVIVVANLAPRKMRFGTSEGMVLTAGHGGNELWLLQPQAGAQPGMPVR